MLKDDYILKYLKIVNTIIEEQKYIYRTKNNLLIVYNSGFWYLIRDDLIVYKDNTLTNLILNNFKKKEIEELKLNDYADIKNKDIYFPFAQKI